MRPNTFLQVAILAILLFLVGFLIRREAGQPSRAVYTYEVGQTTAPRAVQDSSTGPQTLDNPDNPPNCPRCRERMVLRYRKRDWEPFWGCTRFPRCRATLPWQGLSFSDYRLLYRSDSRTRRRDMLWDYRAFIGAPPMEEDEVIERF